MSEQFPEMCYSRIPFFEILSYILRISIDNILMLKQLMDLELKEDNNDK